MKHTKGKWTVCLDQNSIPSVMKSNDLSFRIATMLGDGEEDKANANLIASAPEMLEALLQINNLELDDSFGDHKIALLDWAKKVGKIARTAIAKAEGSHTDYANLIASAPEMLELLKDILGEVRPEISRVNEAAGQTIFNPVATETIDMAKDLIAKAEGKENALSVAGMNPKSGANIE